MANGKFVTYYRVSTRRQGASGLGEEAQREAVVQILNGGGWEVVGEFREVESGKKSEEERPQLAAALALCKKSGAMLLVAKLDRLARNVHFISGLMRSGVKFVAVDLPDANDLTLHIMASFAEHEAKRISERTRDALKAAKACGVVLGKAGPANLKPNIEARQAIADAFTLKLKGQIDGFQARGLSQRQMVDELNSVGIKTARGGTWTQTQVQRLISRTRTKLTSSKPS